MLDRLVKNQAGNSCDAVVIHHARKLERERDEAREAIRALAEHAEAEIQRITKERDEARESAAKWESLSDALERRRNAVAQRADENREWALKAEKERDEAREALASREVVIAQQNVITDLMLERDAARAVANELSDVASKHLSFLLAITPTRPNDTHEKETEKVIDALKPWKKL